MEEKTNYLKTGHHYANVMAPIIFLLVILFFSAWVRFDGIAEQGIFYGDSFRYIKEAKLWADGQPPNFLNEKFYRPVSYFLQGMALRIFGYNDYSIKILHGVMDVSSILLIFIIASLLARNLWVGTSSSLIYAFLPAVVRLTRWEMLHAESTFFTLLTFLFFILSVKRKTGNGFKYFLLALSGFCAGLAANTHPDLAFLAPGYVLCLFMVSYNAQHKKESLRRFLMLSSIFTFFFFAPYLLGFVIFGTQKVLHVFFREISTARYHITAMAGHDSKPLIFFNIFYRLIKYFFYKQFFLTGMLLIGTIFIMIYQKVKKEKYPLWAHLPLILLLSYAFFYSCFLNASATARVLMPLLPLVIFIITLWYYKIFKQFFGKFSLIVFICFFSMLFLLNPKVIPGKTKYKSQYRFVYDILKDHVNSKNKLLIAPVIIPSFEREYRCDLYFGKNAIYLVQLPPKNEYNLQSLKELLKDMNIRYIFLGKHVFTKFLDPDFPLFHRKTYQGWLRNERNPYSLEKDLGIIQAYIRSKGGLLINKNRFGRIYYLTGEKPVQKNTNWIPNGSFEHWWKGLPMGRWKLFSGKISISREATHGLKSIRFEPADKKGTRIIWPFVNTLHLLEAGSKLRICFDAKVGESDKFISFFTAGINGKRRKIKSGTVWYTGKGEWVTLTVDFEMITGMKNLLFNLYLLPGAKEPALVDNLSIELCGTGSENN